MAKRKPEPWIDDVDMTVKECMRGIRALAGNIAGDVGDGDPGARCTGHDKLVNCLTDAIVKVTDSRASHIVLARRMNGEGEE